MYKEINNLFSKARDGDNESIELLLKELNPLIIASIKRYYNNILEFEDLVQEGRLTILECIRDFDDSKDVYPLGYIKAMLKFLYLNKHKRKITLSLNVPIGEDEEDELIDLLESKNDDILEELLNIESINEIRDALSVLTERQKEVIIAYYYDGYSIQDIAKQMGITYRTVVNTKTQALEKMKKVLKEKYMIWKLINNW